MARKKTRPQEDTNVDMTPMLDIVFIMLIFFIVTTSFVKEQAVDLNRPSKSEVQQQNDPAPPIVIKIDETSTIRVGDRVIDVRSVQANVERKLAENPKSSVIIQVHPAANTNTMMLAYDGAKLTSAEKVSVAALAL